MATLRTAYGPDVWATDNPLIRQVCQEAVMTLAGHRDIRALPDLIRSLETRVDDWRVLCGVGGYPQAADRLVPLLADGLRLVDPAVPVQRLFAEVKALGFTGCLNLLHKYINQGRADADRSRISPRRLARMILTRPDNLKAGHHDLLARLTAACPEMTRPAAVVRDFAELLTPCAGNADGLSRWIVEMRSADLPRLHAFTRGLTETATP